jgi:hypothetical protein
MAERRTDNEPAWSRSSAKDPQAEDSFLLPRVVSWEKVFDCPPLDTLFLAFPLAFKGRLVQYVGRVLRPLAEKTSIEVHDYVDFDIPVLARMHGKRLPAYASLGFDTKRRSS